MRRARRSAAGATLLLVGATVSMFGYLSGMMLSMSRMLFALARDGYLPGALASLHPTYRTPQVAIVVTAVPCALAATGTSSRSPCWPTRRSSRST